MQTLNVALPDPLVCTEQELGQFVREGLESGESVPFTLDIWPEIDARVQQRTTAFRTKKLPPFKR